MKVMMTLFALLLTVGINAQKIDQRLTQLVEKSAQRRAQGAEPLDPKAVGKTITVSFNVGRYDSILLRHRYPEGRCRVSHCPFGADGCRGALPDWQDGGTEHSRRQTAGVGRCRGKSAT